MIEQSVLQEHEIPELLSQRYGLHGVREVRALSGGTANCWHILTDEGQYVLKEFQSTYDLDAARIEPRLTDYLRSGGVPTAVFLPTRTGEHGWTVRDRLFHLQTHIDGRIYAQNACPDWLVTDSAKMLAKIHRVLRGFPQLRVDYGPTWFRFDRGRLRDDYKAMVDRAATLEDRVAAERIRADIEFKLRALGQVDGIQIDPSALTYCNSHGDYHIQQIICQGEQIRAVIDFSGACHLPVCWEIARSYSYADPACTAAVINPENMVAYVAAYMGVAELTRHDLEAIPRMYYLQLLRSRYGYRQYLTEGTVGGKRLLEFAHWRTALCRWLHDNLEELSDALVRSLS